MNTTEFIEKSKIIHKDTYDYSKVSYKYGIPLTIICKIHGEFYQRGSVHLGGAGCPKCGRLKSERSKNLKRYNKFLSNFKKSNSTLELVELDYIPKDGYALVKDNLGIVYRMRFEHILNNTTPTLQSAINPTEAFKIKVNLNYPNIKVLDEYKDTYTKIRIEDENGIIYYKCPACILNNKSSIYKSLNKTTAYLQKATIVHGYKYDYSKVDYTDSYHKIEIICKIHGSFLQSPSDHLKGCGCPICRIENFSWSYTVWENKANSSRYFDSYKVYLIKVYNEEESFYKIGKTYTELSTRFKENSKGFPYNYEKCVIFLGNPRMISNLEHHLQRLYKSKKYIPKLTFGGSKECFQDINKEEFIEVCNSFMNNFTLND